MIYPTVSIFFFLLWLQLAFLLLPLKSSAFSQTIQDVHLDPNGKGRWRASTWGAPAVLNPKKTSVDLRFCIDKGFFFTLDDAYTLPKMQGILAYLGGANDHPGFQLWRNAVQDEFGKQRKDSLWLWYGPVPIQGHDLWIKESPGNLSAVNGGGTRRTQRNNLFRLPWSVVLNWWVADQLSVGRRSGLRIWVAGLVMRN